MDYIYIFFDYNARDKIEMLKTHYLSSIN